MVSQNQDAEWGDHPPVRSGSMLSLDGRQRPQVARTPPSYYDAVRSRHSLSHPVGGRQPEPIKQEKHYFPPHEKYNSLPRPLPQRYAVAMTNGHDRFPASSSSSPWPGSAPNTNGGWNSGLTDGVSPSPLRTERPPRPQELPHEYRSPPGPANPVPQVHLPQRSRETLPGHLSTTGQFPGQYNNGHHEQQQPASPLYNKYSAAPPVDDGQQYESHYGDMRTPPNHFPLQSSPHRRRPPTGPRQHPPPPPIPLQQQRLHPPTQPPTVTSPPNGTTVEMRRQNMDRRDTDGSSMHNGRWMRRSYPSTSEEPPAQEAQYYRSHSQELSLGNSHQYDPRYSRNGTLPSRPRSHGADLVLPAPAVSVRTGPLGTYPESRPTHMDHLPPPSSPQPSSLPDMSNGLSPRGSKQPRSPLFEKEGMSKALESKSHQHHQPNVMSLNEALLFPNGLPLRKSMSSSTASLCSEASSASSRARRTQSRSNGEAPIKRVPLNSRTKGGVANEVHAHGKKDKDSVISPSPWAREEKEKKQQRQVQDARRARDEEIEYLEGLPDRTHKQDEILRILRLEREFQKRAEEVADRDDDDEEEDEILDRAEHMERMLRMQEETSRSRSKQQGNSSEPHQHTSANSSDDWLARRKMHHLSRIAEENGDFHRDLHFQNGTDVEQLSEFLDNLSMQAKRQDSPPRQEVPDTDCRRGEEIHNGSLNGYNGEPEIKMFNSYDTNVLNGDDRPHAFPVPAPRTSKTHVPPPVPPKSKVQPDSNGYLKTDDTVSSLESIPAVGYGAIKEIRLSPKADSSPIGLRESQPQWASDLKNPASQALHNGSDPNLIVNGLSLKTERAREVDIANLYASSKMRNGFVDSRPELEKSPELQKLWTSKPEKLTFQDKIRKFSLQAGEEEVPKDKVKNSRAQREIEIKFNEGHSKTATQET